MEKLEQYNRMLYQKTETPSDVVLLLKPFFLIQKKIGKTSKNSCHNLDFNKMNNLEVETIIHKTLYIPSLMQCPTALKDPP